MSFTPFIYFEQIESLKITKVRRGETTKLWGLQLSLN